MNIVCLGARIALLAVFLDEGASRVIGTNQQVMEFVVYGYPDWLRVLTGSAQVVSVLLLWYRETRLIAAAVVCLVIVGTAFTYWRYDDMSALLYPAAWMVLLAFAAWPFKSSDGETGGDV